MSFYVAAPPSGEPAVHPVDEVLAPTKLAVYGAQHVLAFDEEFVARFGPQVAGMRPFDSLYAMRHAFHGVLFANLRLFDLVHDDVPEAVAAPAGA
jgi:hypothetical protein